MSASPGAERARALFRSQAGQLCPTACLDAQDAQLGYWSSPRAGSGVGLGYTITLGQRYSWGQAVALSCFDVCFSHTTVPR